jgi:hypothetical protein
MNKKMISFVFCMLLIFSLGLPATGKNNFEENFDMISNETNLEGLEVECKRYEEKCQDLGYAAGRWVYKYTVKNTGSTNVGFDKLKVEFPTQWDNIDKEEGGAPMGWSVTYKHIDSMVEFSGPDGDQILLGPGGEVNNFIVKTIHWLQKYGGASAIPTEGLQNWTAERDTAPVAGGKVLNELITPKVYENGGGYHQSFPAENSFDKEHETYCLIQADKEYNWVTYDFKAVRQFREFKLYSRNDSSELTSPAEIEIAVGENDDGTIDTVIGEYLLPPAVNGEIVIIDLGEIVEKRYARLSIISRYDNSGYIIPPLDSEYAEVEFTTLTQPANHKPDQPEKPSGPSTGKPGTSYTYSSSATDEDGDYLYYLFDWNDGTDSGWIGPFNTGEIAESTHSWTNKGNYKVKVKAKDKYFIESDWSDPLDVNIPRNKICSCSFIKFILSRFIEITQSLN